MRGDSPLPVIRAWRPFVRRISMWKEALGSSDTEVLARWDALREELASAPSLACDIVGVLVSLAAVSVMISSVVERSLPNAAIGFAMGTIVWLLPGHRWYFAPVRALTAGVLAALCTELRPGMIDDAFAPMLTGRLVKPPTEAFALPIALPVVVAGFALAAAGVRLLSTRAPAPPPWGVALVAAVVLATMVAGGVDYQRATDMRHDAHAEFARKVVELRGSPEHAIGVVRDGIAKGHIDEPAADRLSDLEIAFPNDRTVQTLRQVVDETIAAEERRRDAAQVREERARQARDARLNAVFNACVARCSVPFDQCVRSGYRREFCAERWQGPTECMQTCAN